MKKLYLILIFMIFLGSCGKDYNLTNKDDISQNYSNKTEDQKHDKIRDIDVLSFLEILELYEKGQKKEAKEEALKLYELEKENIDLLSLIGNIYNDEFNFKEGLKYHEKANELSGGKNGNILFNLGLSYQNTDGDKALLYLYKAKEILGDDESVNIVKDLISSIERGDLLNIGTSSISNIKEKYLLGKKDEAKEEALKLYETEKENIELLTLIGNIYNDEFNFEEGIKYYERANKLSGGKDGNILFNLGVSYQDIDRNKALEYLYKAQEILGEDENLNNFIDNLES